MATKTTKTDKTAEAETKTPKGPTWRIGMFRNDNGKLCSVYVRADGTPMAY